MLRNFLSIAFFAASTCTFANDITRTIPMDDQPVVSELRWSGQPQPGFVIQWFTAVNNGLIEVCGAVNFPSNSSRRQSKGVLRKTYAEFEGEKS